MATEVLEISASAPLDEMHTTFPYREWQRREQIPRIEGYYVEDLATLPLQEGDRKDSPRVAASAA